MSISTEVKEIFAQMPGAFLPEKAAGLNKTIVIDLNGEGGGQWTIKLADGNISIDEGEDASPHLALRMAATDFVDLIHGRANPMNLFMAGKVRVEGDVTLAMKFQDLFDQS
jgi:putative sterol carrier protein